MTASTQSGKAAHLETGWPRGGHDPSRKTRSSSSEGEGTWEDWDAFRRMRLSQRVQREPLTDEVPLVQPSRRAAGPDRLGVPRDSLKSRTRDEAVPGRRRADDHSFDSIQTLESDTGWQLATRYRPVRRVSYMININCNVKIPTKQTKFTYAHVIFRIILENA